MIDILAKEEADRILRNTLSEHYSNPSSFTYKLLHELKEYFIHHSRLSSDSSEMRQDILFSENSIREYIKKLKEGIKKLREGITPKEKGLLSKLKNIDFKTLKECLKIYKTEFSSQDNDKDAIKEFLQRLERGKISEREVGEQERKILGNKYLDTMLKGFFGLRGIYIPEGQSYCFKADKNDVAVCFGRVYGHVSISDSFNQFFLDKLTEDMPSNYRDKPKLSKFVILGNDKYLSRGACSNLLKTRKFSAYVLVGVSSSAKNIIQKEKYKEDINGYFDEYPMPKTIQSLVKNGDPLDVIKPLVELVKEEKLEFKVIEGTIYFQKRGYTGIFGFNEKNEKE